MKKIISILLITSLTVACTSPTPRIAVDPSTIVDQETYNKDFDSCLALARTIDLSDETAMKAVGGAVIGAAAVGGVATAVAGAIFAPAIPFIIAGSLAGGGLWGSSVSKEEKSAREAVLTGCLRNKGYSVYSSRDF